MPALLIYQQPAVALPLPARRAALFGQHIVDAVGTPHHQQAIGHLVLFPHGELAQLGIHIQRADLQLAALIFLFSGEPLHRHGMAEEDGVRLGGSHRRRSKRKQQNDSFHAHQPSFSGCGNATRDRGISPMLLLAAWSWQLAMQTFAAQPASLIISAQQKPWTYKLNHAGSTHIDDRECSTSPPPLSS